MEFSVLKSIEILSNTPQVLEHLLRNLSNEWTSVNEGPDTWSAYDIVGHLIHGEKTDWIPRMEIILSNKTDKKFEPFDRNAQFVESKNKTLNNLLDEFKTLREENVEILRSKIISDQVLEKTGIHPAFGEVSLKQLIATWVVHDLNHLSQAARVMAKQYKTETGPWVEYLPILTK